MSSPWSLVHVKQCESTFIPARKLAPWTAVYCTEQSHGRGRFNRAWFGAKGGLWVCYNIPLDDSKNLHWGILPLIAGAALIDSLQDFKIDGLRLRWPNDLMVGRMKLGGILVERPSKSMASIGIGLNMFNSMELLEGKTSDRPTRLSDHVRKCPSVEVMCRKLGDAITDHYEAFLDKGPKHVIKNLEKAWNGHRPVVAITDQERFCGIFKGVAHDGSPILEHADGHTTTVPGIQINRLQELD